MHKLGKIFSDFNGTTNVILYFSSPRDYWDFINLSGDVDFRARGKENPTLTTHQHFNNEQASINDHNSNKKISFKQKFCK